MDAIVSLWGEDIGILHLEDGQRTASFQYLAPAIANHWEIAPLTMPLSRRTYQFPALPFETFKGFPGVFADSLPDRFGNAVINAWLARQGRQRGSLSPIERLLYTGQRGMGAIEYKPPLYKKDRSEKIAIDEIVALADAVLTDRKDLKADIDEGLEKIVRVGTSAGGARAKALVAINRASGELRSGQVQAPEGFEYCLIKFDGVGGNGDHDFLDPLGYTNIEYAYHLMAKRAGIRMSECWLLEENGRAHFVTRRFDRTEDGSKLHMASLGGLCHYDFNSPGCAGYEDAASAASALGLGNKEREEIYRRMVFNVVFRNQDDHVKNIAFLMDRAGVWQLAPAFDLTFSYRTDSKWTSVHQMSVNGKVDGFSRSDLKEAAISMKLKTGLWQDILEEILDAAGFWLEAADMAGLDESAAAAIGKEFRLSLPSL